MQIMAHIRKLWTEPPKKNKKAWDNLNKGFAIGPNYIVFDFYQHYQFSKILFPTIHNENTLPLHSNSRGRNVDLDSADRMWQKKKVEVKVELSLVFIIIDLKNHFVKYNWCWFFFILLRVWISLIFVVEFFCGWNLNVYHIFFPF